MAFCLTARSINDRIATVKRSIDIVTLRFGWRVAVMFLFAFGSTVLGKPSR